MVTCAHWCCDLTVQSGYFSGSGSGFGFGFFVGRKKDNSTTFFYFFFATKIIGEEFNVGPMTFLHRWFGGGARTFLHRWVGGQGLFFGKNFFGKNIRKTLFRLLNILTDRTDRPHFSHPRGVQSYCYCAKWIFFGFESRTNKYFLKYSNIHFVCFGRINIYFVFTKYMT